jgi:hypothetical protein
MAHFDGQARRAAEFRAFDSDHWLHASISYLVLTLASAEEIKGQSAVLYLMASASLNPPSSPDISTAPTPKFRELSFDSASYFFHVRKGEPV